MSLKIWLPLNGTLENKGISDIKVTNSSAAVNASGKIGQCYYFNGSAYLSMPSLDGINSICFWLKTTKTASKVCLADYKSGIGFGFSAAKYMVVSCHGRNIPMYNDSSVIVDDIWTHIALVNSADNSDILLYVNGILQTSNRGTGNNWNHSSDTLQLGRRVYSSNNANMTCYLNDFRAYDHRLSAAEVKEIAQGLVLHYKLDQGGINWNLLHDTNAPSLTAIKGSKNRYFESADSGTYTCTFEQITDPPVPGIIYGVRQQVSSVSGFHSQVWYSGANVSAFNNITHTMSCYVKRISGTNLKLKFQYGKNPYVNTTVDISNDNDWHQYSWTFVPSDSAASSNTTKYYVGGLWSVGEILICGWKVERSDYATPWTPSYAELQEQIGIDVTKVVDSSGYGHCGTQLAASQGGTSARNNNCTTITDGTTNYITTPELYFNKEAITMNIWFKSQNTAPTGNYHMVVDSVSNRNWYEMCISYSGYFRAGLTVNDTRYVDNCSTTTALDGQWHMLTLTYDGATIKRYFDGELEKSTTVAISSGLSGPTALRIGRDGPDASYACQQAQLSDFRIYCTPLLDNDIKMLYNTSMRIDKNGQIHTNELYEINQIKIAKNAITLGNIIEIPRLLYDNQIHIEPDGSLWVHLFHHNAPATNGYFEDVTDEQFEHSIYLNEHKWFNMELCNYVNKWEILTVRRYSSADDFVRNRWIQPVNPMIATYEDVKWDNLTLYGTAEGYNTYTSSNPSNYSGYWHFTAGTGSYLASSYSSAGYFGALGQRKAWNGGVASFNSNKSANAIKSGSIDVYLRIDNVKLLNCSQSSISKNINAWLTTQAIER